jgi:hypothetical protein
VTCSSLSVEPGCRISGASFSASAPHYNIETFMNIRLVLVEQDGVFDLDAQPEHARRASGGRAMEASEDARRSHFTV